MYVMRHTQTTHQPLQSPTPNITYRDPPPKYQKISQNTPPQVFRFLIDSLAGIDIPSSPVHVLAWAAQKGLMAVGLFFLLSTLAQVMFIWMFIYMIVCVVYGGWSRRADMGLFMCLSDSTLLFYTTRKRQLYGQRS